MNLTDIKDIQRAIRWRVIFFLLCFVSLMAFAGFTAVNPKATIEILGFQPFKNEEEMKIRLTETCLQIEILEYAKNVYSKRITEFEDAIKRFGAKEIQSQSEKSSAYREPKKYDFKFNEQNDFSTRLFYGSGSNVNLLESYATEKWARIDWDINPNNIECLNRMNFSEDTILSCYGIRATMSIRFHQETEKMNSKFSEYLPKLPFPLDETLLSTDQTRITVTDLIMNSSFFDKDKRKQLFEYAQQHHTLQGIFITNSDMENLIKQDKKMQKEMAEKLFQKIERTYMDVVSSHTDIVKELNKVNNNLEYILTRFASNDVLYASILAHRVLMGIVFITIMTLLLKVILTDLNLQRTIHIGEISRAYAKKDLKKDITSEEFKEMFELFGKSVGINFMEDKNKKNIDFNQLLEENRSYFEKFLDTILQKISPKQS